LKINQKYFWFKDFIRDTKITFIKGIICDLAGNLGDNLEGDLG
jgi:hypothetical protein